MGVQVMNEKKNQILRRTLHKHGWVRQTRKHTQGGEKPRSADLVLTLSPKKDCWGGRGGSITRGP